MYDIYETNNFIRGMKIELIISVLSIGIPCGSRGLRSSELLRMTNSRMKEKIFQ